MDNISNAFGIGSSGSSSSAKKEAVMAQIRNQQALEQARTLIEKVTENCFEKCIPKPGSTLSGGEETCLTKCMEKYMNAWNTVSRQYINRIQKGDGVI